MSPRSESPEPKFAPSKETDLHAKPLQPESKLEPQRFKGESEARSKLPERPAPKGELSEVRKSLRLRAWHGTLNGINSARHSAADAIRANPIKSAIAGTALGVAMGAGIANGSKDNDE
jgi:hypothetical protein